MPARWAAYDEVYGRSGKMRRFCESRGLAYVAVIPRDFRITVPSGTVIKAEDGARDAVFEQRSCGNGSKGPRFADWALLAMSSPRHFLLIRRLISRPGDLTFYLCWAPEGIPATMTFFVTIAGRRWPAEETFKTGKASIAHCASFPSGILEWSSLGGFYLDTQAAAASAADMHSGEFATLDLMQNGLPGDAEGGGGLPQW